MAQGIRTVEELRVDRVVVVNFVEHLRKAFEDYVNAEAAKGESEEIKYPEALMAVHNFHKLIVMDIEERTGIKAQGPQAVEAYRNLWVQTFAISLLGTDAEKDRIRAKNQS